MASDARVRYTKSVIIENFTNLLQTRPINKITVKEICNLSEINRATFYKHYIDVYDLLEKIETQFLEELKEVLVSREHNTIKDVLTFIMIKFKAEENKYKPICSNNGDPSFPAKLFEVCYEIVVTQKDFIYPNLSTVQKNQLYHFIAHGCNGIINQWIADGMKEPISNIADFTERLITNTLSNL